MIVFSLRRFKGGAGRFMLVDDALAPGHAGPTRGQLCAARGQLHTSRPDQDMTLFNMVEIDDPGRLEPATPEAKKWLEMRLEMLPNDDKENGTR